MKNYDLILKEQLKNKYFTSIDLKYKNENAFSLSPYDLYLYLDFKDSLLTDNNSSLVKLPLRTFNSKYIYYASCNELNSYILDYHKEIQNDLNENGSLLSTRMRNNLVISRIYSEIEGSLNVENVPTTRKRLKDLIEKNIDPQNKNDTIIKNMDLAIKFIVNRPLFNKENLYKLYNILSKDCLDEDNKLKEGEYYRYDLVEVGGYKGCPVDKIEECMNSLFEYVNLSLNSSNNSFLPHICHYYILYIHPYFDYNGRTARMVSFWIYLLMDKSNKLPPLISEAINQTKNKYYEAIEESRDSHNDITYFLMYIYKTSINYYLCYRNIEYISNYVKHNREVLTDNDLNYIKRILISSNGPFTYLDFLKMSQIDISKQGTFKILNKFVSLGILVSRQTKSGNKLFELNKKVVKFKGTLKPLPN